MMQPVIVDNAGVVRFKRNAIVCALLEAARRKMDLNDICLRDFSTEDIEQFWQLLGYSISGYGDLSFIREETVAIADAKAEELVKTGAVKR